MKPTFDQLLLNTRIARFWNRVDLSDLSGCWNFKLSKNRDGYGWYKTKLIGECRAHRTAFILTFGNPLNPVICHHCDNPSCCNPWHLFSGTRKDNFKDMVSKGRNGFRNLIEVKDEFSDLKVSRQRKYELRMKRDGRCMKCGVRIESGRMCKLHKDKRR